MKRDPTAGRLTDAGAAPAQNGATARLWALVTRDIVRFAGVSGVGWLTDMALFAVLTGIAVPTGIANTISAAVAVTYVFICSTRFVFIHDHRFLWEKFFAYCAYQVAAILLASAAIVALHELIGGHPIIAKILVTPITFYVNYIVTAFIIQGVLRFR